MRLQKLHPSQINSTVRGLKHVYSETDNRSDVCLKLMALYTTNSPPQSLNDLTVTYREY